MRGAAGLRVGGTVPGAERGARRRRALRRGLASPRSARYRPLSRRTTGRPSGRTRTTGTERPGSACGAATPPRPRGRTCGGSPRWRTGGPGGPGPRARRCRAPRPSACSRPPHARARRGRLRGRGGSARCTASQGRGLRRARPLPLGCGAARGYHDRTSLGALEQHRSDHGVLILGRPRTDLRLGGRSHRRAPAPGDPDSGPIRGQDGHRLLRVRSRRGRARPAAPADDPEIGRRAVRRRPARNSTRSVLRAAPRHAPPCVRLASEITRERTNGSRGSVAARTVNAKRGRSGVGGRAHTTRSPR